jgi:hypothetical protein
MKKTIGSILVLFLFLAQVAYSDNKTTESISAKTSQLNQHAISLLQIDLNSLRWLLGASPNSYLLYSSLEEDGQLPSIHALEEKGYVTLEIVDQLPDGQEKDKFLRIIPTPKGYQII